MNKLKLKSNTYMPNVYEGEPRPPILPQEESYQEKLEKEKQAFDAVFQEAIKRAEGGMDLKEKLDGYGEWVAQFENPSERDPNHAFRLSGDYRVMKKVLEEKLWHLDLPEFSQDFQAIWNRKVDEVSNKYEEFDELIGEETRGFHRDIKINGLSIYFLLDKKLDIIAQHLDTSHRVFEDQYRHASGSIILSKRDYNIAKEMAESLLKTKLDDPLVQEMVRETMNSSADRTKNKLGLSEEERERVIGLCDKIKNDYKPEYQKILDKHYKAEKRN